MTLYASTDQIKAALRITDNVDDSLIAMAGSAASSLIDTYCQRSFGTVTGTRYFAPHDNWVLAIDDLAGTAVTIETASVADQVYDVTWTASDYQLEPLNGTAEGTEWAYTRVRAVGDYMWPTAYGETTVKMTGTWGWPSIPPVIAQAAVIEAGRLYRRLDAPLGVAGFGDMGAVRVSSRLDPDVQQLLAPYVRHRGVA